MATLGGTAVTLLDIVKSSDPDGKPAKIVELMSQNNGFVEHCTWMPCNDGDSHQTTIRTGLPAVAQRRYNRGTAPTKGLTVQVRAQTAKYETVCAIDQDLAEKGGVANAPANRANQAAAHIQALGQKVATALIYEDERTTIDGPTGIMPHYASVSTATAASAENVIDGGGTGSDNLSVLLVGFGPTAVSGLYGEGQVAGLKNTDDKIVDIIDATSIEGATYKGYRERFSQQCGLVITDWTQAGRVCNVDVSNLRANSSDADLVTLMILLSERVRRGAAKYVWLMNRTARAYLRLQKLEKIANSTISWETVEGKPVMFFDGIPVAIEDALLNTEARVV